MTTRVQPLAQPQPHPSLTPRHTDSHIRSLLRPFGGQPAMGTVVPSLSPQKQDLSKTIQAGPTAGPEWTSCPLLTSVHSLPGRATPQPPPTLFRDRRAPSGRPPHHLPVQHRGARLCGLKGGPSASAPCSFPQGSRLRGAQWSRGLDVGPSIHVAEGLACWPQELSLCPLDMVRFES